LDPPPIHPSDPLEETVDEGVSSEKEDAPEQIEPEHPPSPSPQLVELIPRHSNRMRRAPIQDDDERFERTSYSKNTTNTVGKAATARANRANISDEPPTYKATMSSPEAAQWQIVCMEELKSLQDMNIYEEIYLRPPPGADTDKSLIWRLHRPLYGLKQSSRQWYQEVYAKFTNLGFTRLEADHSIFQRGKGSQLIIVAIYVDNMLIFAESIDILTSFKRQLSNTFPIFDLGEARWILNMEIICN
jgi:hypothetical protein